MISAVTFHPKGSVVIVKPWTSDARRYLSEETRLQWDREQGGYLARPADVPELREVLLDEGLVMSAFRRNMRHISTHWSTTGIHDVLQPAACGTPKPLHGYLRTSPRPRDVTCTKCRRLPAFKAEERMRRNPDEDDFDELDDEIESALEAEADLDADRNACVALSSLGDQAMMDLEEMGYDDQTAVVISETWKATAVNGEILAHEAGKAVEWSEVGTGRLLSELRSEGFEEVPRMGGAWPGGMEIELSSEHIIRHVARELGVQEERVERVAELIGWGELVYRTSGDVDTTYYAKRRAD
jgi:hypothetical protein